MPDRPRIAIDPEARRKAFVAMIAAGMQNGEIADALGVSLRSVRREIASFGLESAPPPGPPIHEIEGEEWREVPGYDALASSLGRMWTLRDHKLLQRFRQPTGKRDMVRLVRTDGGRSHEMLVDRVMSLTFGIPFLVRARSWTLEEDAALKAQGTLRDAVMALPRRSAKAIEIRAAKIGKRFRRTFEPTGVIKGSVPYENPLWSAANAVVSRGLPEDVRDDLISSMVLMHLEGIETDMRVALKLAIRERNQIMGTYKERSYDAPIPGTDGLRLIDTFDNTVEHV